MWYLFDNIRKATGQEASFAVVNQTLALVVGETVYLVTQQELMDLSYSWSHQISEKLARLQQQTEA
jgi:hypothetical protein